ncbi:MAG: Bax inhibitor-1/YccA family protein [Actinobacteria bacterium]|nr:Bax inhibitor-1/YccA family protein [Actinomycetota bacterium]
MSNPVIERVVGEYSLGSNLNSGEQVRPLTLDAVINKAIITAIFVGVGAIAGWTLAPAIGFGTILLLALGGLALGLINTFKREVSPFLVMAYGLVQGGFAGGISYALNLQYPGVAQQAFLGASVTFGTVLVLYAFRIVRSGPKFLRFLQYAVISYLVFALISFGFALFGMNEGWGFYGGSFGLLFAGIGVVLATLSLIADFGAIEAAVELQVPEREAWRLAFGVTVTFIWLYIELLRLLSLLARSNE